MTLPDASLSTLNGADGSATYSANGFTLVGAVNGPIEVQRRDELPEEATLEVNIRSAIGVGSTRERHLETVVHSALRRIILTHAFPRSLIQLTLQIISSPEQLSTGLGASDLLVLPALLQTALLTLLSSSIPLECTLTSVALGATVREPGTVVELDSKNAASLGSLHVFAFTSSGQLLLAQSEGSFTTDAWEAAHDRAQSMCCDSSAEKDRMQIEGEGADLQQWLRGTVREQVAKDQAWRR